MIVDEVMHMKATEGYNALTAEYGDMFKMGVIDPAKVTRCALQNAASIAGLMLTTDVVITDEQEEEDEGGEE